ncbi:hypothetical protein IEQ34_012223 [Dendrobium chrysotoxum]|uniref:Uncharacterized protein n=1 Tax=Dendrobium chrysotoxum TaxID=161865 RepID=A0AAV7GV36_DENCH|nr:hypothetical protein IEQ34_012223 [Dendrobium chrysotoxum]
MTKNIDLIFDGKRKNHKFISSTQGGIKKLKNPPKYIPKGISNGRAEANFLKTRPVHFKALISFDVTSDSGSLCQNISLSLFDNLVRRATSSAVNFIA